MNCCKVIELESWPRRKLFEFYRRFDSACFNITVSVGATPIRDYAHRRGESFFLLCLYAILRAANAIPQFRQRRDGERAVEYDRIAIMTPIMTNAELFQQIWCEYHDTFAAFKAEAAPKIAAAKRGEPMPLENHGEDFLCASCLPWLHFDSITQADLDFNQTVPILAWGKLEEGKIPISVKCNHCFVDGLHVTRFFEAVQRGFAAPETLE